VSIAIREGAEGYFRTQYGTISKMAAVLCVLIYVIYMFRRETREQLEAGLTRQVSFGHRSLTGVSFQSDLGHVDGGLVPLRVCLFWLGRLHRHVGVRQSKRKSGQCCQAVGQGASADSNAIRRVLGLARGRHGEEYECLLISTGA